jgi:hypothetical protein
MVDKSQVNKELFIGGCSRLDIQVDADRLAKEVGSLDAMVWSGTAGRVGPHMKVDAVFLRGYAAAEGPKPLEDREILKQLPYVREVIYEALSSQPQRCVLASLQPDSVVRAHQDQGPYFSQHYRFHIPVFTSPHVKMVVEHLVYQMLPGEIWAINNNAPHGVVNDDPDEARAHIIVDYKPTAEIVGLLERADKSLGTKDTETINRLISVSK